MRFEGEELLAILRNQKQAVQLCDAAGAPFVVVAPAIVCSFVEGLRADGFFGVGNKKRIRYVQAKSPRVWGTGWRGGSHTTQRIRNDWGVIISPPRHVEHRPVLNS